MSSRKINRFFDLTLELLINKLYVVTRQYVLSMLLINKVEVNFDGSETFETDKSSYSAVRIKITSRYGANTK